MSKKLKVQAPKGMHDILPTNQPYWQFVIKNFEEIAINSSYQKIDTPIIEDINLFIKTIGETSDIVSKEMFLLEKKKEDGIQYVLRPEFTAPIARAYVQHGLKTMSKPVKLYSYGPVFRYQKPQSGYVRQLHQLNMELYGSSNSSADAELISIAWQLFTKLGLNNIQLHINSIGSAENRPNLINLLVDYFQPQKNQLCLDCQNRLKKNPFRILDCKQKSCQKIADNAPQIIDHIDKESKNHFSEILEYLDELEIPYVLDPKLVRGLDYYTKTVFEFVSTVDGLSICGGGRYDELLTIFGEEHTPAVGFGLGIERLIMNLIANGIKPKENIVESEIFLIQLGENAKRKCFKLLHQLRSAGMRVSSNLSKKSISSQLKLANKYKSRFAVIIGQKEAIDNTIIIRDMKTGVQDIIDWDHAVSEIKNRLG